MNFDELWARHQESRKIAAGINPDGNRCAVVLGLTLKVAFKPRKQKGEITFREIKQPPQGIRGQPFLDKFYVKAEQFAARMEEEWGAPDYAIPGSRADELQGVQGFIFVENAWNTTLGGKTVDHVDLWNGTQLGAYDPENSMEYMKRADTLKLWKVYSP